MNFTLRGEGLLLLTLFLLSSCASTKNIAYFQDISNGVRDTSESMSHAPGKPTIEPDDILLITVSGSNPAAAAIFNQGTNNSTSQTYIGASSTAGSIYSQAADLQLGYLVDNHGAINFPVLGHIYLKGITLIQAQ